MEKRIKMKDANHTLSVITLNVNQLYNLIKHQKFTD